MADDIASLGFEVNSAPLQQATVALGGLAGASTLAGSQATRMANEMRVAQGASAALAQVAQALQLQMIAMAGGLGLVGTALAALGPAGLAAGVVLKLLGDAIKFVAEESARMGDKAIAVRQFAEVTGLTAREISGLRQAAAQFGISGDQVTTSIERLTFQMNDARQASGPLFEGIREVNGGLADALTNSKTSAEGIDVLARAWRDAGNEAQKAAIARAAFGRAGAGAGPVLGAIADAGGIDALSQSTKTLTEATDKQNKEWAKMRAETVLLEKQAANILASIFTPAGLKAAHDAAEALVKFNQGLKDSIELHKGLTPFQQGLDVGGGLDPGAPLEALAARNKLQQGQGKTLGADPKEIESWGKLADAMNGIVTPAEAAAASMKDLQDAAQAASNLEKERIELLGAAATADERRVSTLTDLTAAFLKNKMSVEDYNRAINAVNLDTEASKTQALIGVLGSLAGTQLLVSAAEDKIAQARSRGITVTAEQEMALIALARVQAEMAQVAPGTYERQLEELNKLKAAYPGLTAAQATAARELDNQLRLAQAVTGAEKMMAQAAITYQAELSKGATAAEALAISVKGIAIAQAEVNASVIEQTRHLEQQADLIHAAATGTEAKVKAEQAYVNAIRAGASTSAADALADATERLANSQKQQAVNAARLNALEQQRLEVLKQQNAEELKYIQEQEAIYNGTNRLINAMNFSGSSGRTSQSGSGGSGLGFEGSPTQAQGYSDPIMQLLRAKEMYEKQGYKVEIVQGGRDSIPTIRLPDKAEVDAKRAQDAADKARHDTVNQFEMRRVESQISGDKPGEIKAVQDELNYYKSQPKSLETLNAQKSLIDALKTLTESTDALKTTLDPIYSQGRDAFKTGFYEPGGGSAVSKGIVTGAPGLSGPNATWKDTLPQGVAPGSVQPNPMGAPPGLVHWTPGNLVGGPGGLMPALAGGGQPYLGVYHAATGLYGTVGGSGGTDSQLFQSMVGPGEHIAISPPGEPRPASYHIWQDKQDNDKGVRGTVVNNVTNINNNNVSFNVRESANLGDRTVRRHMMEGAARERAAVS